MAKKLLVEKKGRRYLSKDIKILEDPTKLSPAINKVALKILCEISSEPAYPKELARRLRMDRQKVYYHIRKLESSGLVKVVREVRKGGAICKFYSPTSGAFGFELSPFSKEISLGRSYKVERFFEEFIESGIFDGAIVVGSPTPHGPFLTAARDGHYATHLALFLGSLCELPKKEDVVKLDTEIKAEHGEKRNMILIGGPITNMITAEVNEKLKIRFKWEEVWKIFSELSGKQYVDEDLGIVAKIKNPWDESRRIVLLSGLKFDGTKSCVLAVTSFFDKLFGDYEGRKDLLALIKGLDRDGDGKADDIVAIEKAYI